MRTEARKKQLESAGKNLLITVGILCLCFGFCLVIQSVFQDNALIPAIFTLGVFLTSIVTQGYIYGILSSLLSMLAVNFAFTFPFFAFNFTMSENILSAALLLVVTILTCSLTAQLRRQEMMKAERDKERMRANLLRAVSHDLRTPLTTIYGASSALLDQEADFTQEQRRRMLRGIQEDAEWLSSLVENLLSVTRLDGGNVVLIKTETVVEELIDAVLLKFAKRYPEQEVQVEIPEEFLAVPMDALLIQQVLINLLENAVQHARGMKKLELRVSSISGKAVFEVCDDGCGMPEEKCRQIFSGVYSAEEILTDEKAKNAGIGLSVCAAIIRAHGGEIRAENQKDGGLRVRFTLNLEDTVHGA